MIKYVIFIFIDSHDVKTELKILPNFNLKKSEFSACTLFTKFIIF